MERLTKRGNDSVVRYKKDGLFLEPCEIPSYGDIKTILDRLAYYEDMEEQGRLVVLPCKVGETVYVTESRFYLGKEHTGIQKGIVYGYELVEGCGWVIWVHMEGETYSGNAYRFSDFGKTVFLTREEAEQALRGDMICGATGLPCVKCNPGPCDRRRGGAN